MKARCHGVIVLWLASAKVLLVVWLIVNAFGWPLFVFLLFAFGSMGIVIVTSRLFG